MVEYVRMPKADYEAACNSIRAKTGKTELIKSGAMSAEIDSITTGGGSSDDVRYVTFRNESTGEEYVKAVATGDDCVDVVAKGLWATPTKESDAQYDYTFYGWGAEDGGAADSTILQNITENKTVYAIYTATVRTYTITWLDEDGSTVLATTKVAYGSVPSYTPSKDGCIFDSWSPTPTAVTGEASYTAVWKEVIAGTCSDTVFWELSADTGELRVYGVGEIPDYAYNGKPWQSNKALITSVTIEEGITKVGEQSFSSCTNLETVAIPDTVETICKYAFNGCTALKTVSIGSGVKLIWCLAFQNCSGLKSANFAKTTGWYVADYNTSTSGTNLSESDVANPSTVAYMLFATYASKFWHNK